MTDHFPEFLSLASILAEQHVHPQEGLWVRINWPKTTKGMTEDEMAGWHH